MSVSPVVGVENCASEVSHRKGLLCPFLGLFLASLLPVSALSPGECQKHAHAYPAPCLCTGHCGQTQLAWPGKPVLWRFLVLSARVHFLGLFEPYLHAPAIISDRACPLPQSKSCILSPPDYSKGFSVKERVQKDQMDKVRLSSSRCGTFCPQAQGFLQPPLCVSCCL